MPGTEITRKQQNIGGTIGIIVLGAALVYRFFPNILHVTPQEQQPVSASAAVPIASTPWTAELPVPNAPLATVPGSPEEIGTTFADAVSMGPPAPVTKVVAATLKRARAAEEQGKILDPPDNNAITLYRAVLDKDAKNADALTGLKRLGGAIRDWAIAAMQRGDEESAQRYVAAVGDLPHAENELANLREELKTLHQVMPLLAHAAGLLQQGKIEGTGDETALAVYRKVMTIDPGNSLADQGLAKVERGYLDRALAASAQDDFAETDRILASAAAIRPGSQALQDTRARIEGIRHQRADMVLAQARSALDSGNPDMAEDLAKKAQAISPDLGGLDDFNQRVRNARLYASYKPGQVLRDNFLAIAGTAPALVVIPTGSFVMGSAADEEDHRDSEEPQRRVSISTGFALGQTDVTVSQFRDFVRAASYKSDAEKIGAGSFYDENTGRLSDRRGVDWKNDFHGERGGDNLPVINVSWNDAVAYVAWLTQQTGKSYRLPSETEFEYALRAGSVSRYPWGDGNPDRVIGNFTGEGDRSSSRRSWSRAFPNYSDGYWGPAPVKSFPPNAFGLYDMAGNVSEWVLDCWHDNFTRAPRDSQAWVNPGCQRHVVRGASWGSAPEQVRSAYRTSAPADTRSAQIGFRVARDL